MCNVSDVQHNQPYMIHVSIYCTVISEKTWKLGESWVSWSIISWFIAWSSPLLTANMPILLEKISILWLVMSNVTKSCEHLFFLWCCATLWVKLLSKITVNLFCVFLRTRILRQKTILKIWFHFKASWSNLNVLSSH